MGLWGLGFHVSFFSFQGLKGCDAQADENDEVAGSCTDSDDESAIEREAHDEAASDPPSDCDLSEDKGSNAGEGDERAAEADCLVPAFPHLEDNAAAEESETDSEATVILGSHLAPEPEPVQPIMDSKLGDLTMAELEWGVRLKDPSFAPTVAMEDEEAEEPSAVVSASASESETEDAESEDPESEDPDSAFRHKIEKQATEVSAEHLSFTYAWPFASSYFSWQAP